MFGVSIIPVCQAQSVDARKPAATSGTSAKASEVERGFIERITAIQQQLKQPIHKRFRVFSTWQGVCYQPGYEYPMVVFVSEIDGNRFKGTTWYPTLGNGLCAISGKYDAEGNISFKEESVEHGSVVSGGEYSALLNDELLEGTYLSSIRGEDASNRFVLRYSMEQTASEDLRALKTEEAIAAEIMEGLSDPNRISPTSFYMEHLKQLTHLRALALRNVPITDDDLVYLSGLTQLESLVL